MEIEFPNSHRPDEGDIVHSSKLTMMIIESLEPCSSTKPFDLSYGPAPYSRTSESNVEPRLNACDFTISPKESTRPTSIISSGVPGSQIRSPAAQRGES